MLYLKKLKKQGKEKRQLLQQQQGQKNKGH